MTWRDETDGSYICDQTRADDAILRWVFGGALTFLVAVFGAGFWFGMVICS